VVDQESTVLFDEDRFSDELTRRLREPLLPEAEALIRQRVEDLAKAIHAKGWLRSIA
jgi:hypothetical protein